MINTQEIIKKYMETFMGVENSHDDINVKKLIYISHPSSGLEENTRDIEKIIRKLYAEDDIFNEYCFLSPVHNFGFMYHDTEYYRGLTYCTDLLYFCDEIWVFGDWKSSRGCTIEVELASKLGIKTRFLGNSSELDKVIESKSYKLDYYINTPSQKREINRNKTLFLYVESKALDNKDTFKLNSYIKKKVLYGDRNVAFSKVSEKYNKENYTLIEVEIDGNTILDLDDNRTAVMLDRVIDSKLDKKETEKAIKTFALNNGNKTLKRFVRGNKKISENCNLTKGNKEIYKILDCSCIKSVKIYDTYVINDNEQVRTFTFIKSFN